MSGEHLEARARPQSDVSHGVGLSGLAGLFAWLLICRSWPAISPLIGLGEAPGPMSGPYAALATMLWTGLPMAAWSILVDKVHLRASTGLDWRNLHPATATREVSVTKLAGLWATWALIGVLYCVARWYWDGNYLFAMKVLGFSAIPLVLLSIPYVFWLDRRMVAPRDDAWHFGAMLIGREAFEPEAVKSHLRRWAVKGFFCAFMLSIVPGGFAYIVNFDLAQLALHPVTIAAGLIELLFLIDVQMAMVGYVLTMKPLDAQIRSANPYVAGWVAALICYPPFILMGDGGPLNYHPNTSDWAFWFEGQTALLWVWGAWLVFLTAIYAWATVIFGLRFSNLTYRGVITNGPYRFTRHPAYLAKNLFWWSSTLPFFATSGSPVDMIRNTALLALVSAVYFWRAKTEEKHLLGEDAKYRAYHAWMANNAPITRLLGRAARIARPRAPSLQPAE